MSTMPQRVRETASGVTLLILDVDGVLTDGRIVYGAQGEQLKIFNAKDGQGIRLAMAAGIEIAVISGRRSDALDRRLHDLGIQRSYTGVSDKSAALSELLADVGVSLEHVAYMGDDIADLPVMRVAGLPIAVSDAHPMAREAATWITTAAGGRGAVREVTDGLISSRANLEEVVERYLASQVSDSSSERTP